MRGVAIILAKLYIALCIFSIFGCDSAHELQREDKGFGSIVGANYTSNGIQSFTVDGAWGGNIHPYSGGGSFVCCASLPRRWSPTLTVSVQWRRSDGRALDGQWRIRSLEQVVAVEKYVTSGNIYVLFFPDDKVKVYVSEVGVGSPLFPSNPGYPENAKKGVK